MKRKMGDKEESPQKKAKMQDENEYVLTYDVESTGRSLKHHFMPDIGLSVVNVPEERVVATFQSYVAQPEGRGWEPRCLEEFWLQEKNKQIYEQLLAGIKTAPPPEKVVLALVQFVREHAPKNRTTVVSDTAGYDHAWLDLLLADHPEQLSTQYLLDGSYRTPRDLNSMMLGASRYPTLLHLQSIKGLTKDVIGVVWPNNPLFKHSHRAVSDAAFIGLNTARFLNHVAKRSYPPSQTEAPVQFTSNEDGELVKM